LLLCQKICFEPSDNIVTSFISDSPGSYLFSISSDTYPQIEIQFTGKHSKRANELVDVEEFIGCKSLRAKGKRLTTFEVGSISFTEPLVKENSSEIIDVIEGDDSDAPDITENDSSSDNMDDQTPTLF